MSQTGKQEATQNCWSRFSKPFSQPNSDSVYWRATKQTLATSPDRLLCYIQELFRRAAVKQKAIGSQSISRANAFFKPAVIFPQLDLFKTTGDTERFPVNQR